MGKLSTILHGRWQWLIRLFSWYVRRYLARHFHAVRLAKAAPEPAVPPGPVVVALTHPSWWDPLVAMVLTERLTGREHVGPIDARALERYRFLGRLGLFGVEQGSRRGYDTLLAVGDEMNERRDVALWITPQGRFTDARSRPVSLKPGIGHVLHRLDRATVVPLALEYVFWDERLPEALARFGQPVEVRRGAERTPEEWVQVVADALEAASDDLARDAESRDEERFETLVGGGAGVNVVYDAWRQLRAWVRGERLSLEHGSIAREMEARR